MGISDYDFKVPRDRETIKYLFEKIGFSYKVGKFNAMFNRAKDAMGGTSGDYVSVRAFMQSVNEMHTIE
jgi:hypothetical protein